MLVNTPRPAAIRHLSYSILAILLCMLLQTSAALCAEDAAQEQAARPYTLGVFPYLPARELERIFAPIAARFAAVLGVNVQLRTSRSYEMFMQQLDTQQFDIVFVQPFDYVRIADQHGYAALATREEPLAAVIVVKADSPYKTMQDIRGKHLATPPAVAAVTYLTMAYLQEQGIDPQTDIDVGYHRSHVSCMQKVIIGTAAACATAAPALRFFTHKMDVQFNIIGKSSAIPHTLFATHPRLGTATPALLLAEIVSWNNSAEGRDLLARGKFKPFLKIDDHEYDGVRRFIRRIKIPQAH